MSSRRSRTRSRRATLDWGSAREDYPFWTLLALLAVAFLMGGSGRDDVLSLILLRPLAVVALAIGLYGLTRDEIRAFRGLLIGAAALIALIALHLVPLPPSIWTSLPGRELAREAGEVAGIAQPWRPLSLIPWRGWNSLFAALVPLAALILAIRCTARQREHLVKAVLILVLASMLWAVVQIASGYAPSLSLYRVTNENSPTGLFANRNHFAILICCAAPLLAFLAARRDEERDDPRHLRWWLVAAAGCAAIVLLLVIGSRAGLVLAFVGAALAASILARGRGRSEGRGRLLAVAGGGAVLALTIALAAYFSRAEALERLFAQEGEENRLATWGPIAQMVWSYFPFGSGIGAFVDVYRIAEPRELLHFSYLNHAHNDWLEWVLETGLPGLLLLISAVAGWATRTARLLAARGGERAGRLALVGAAVLLLLALGSVADYPLRAPAIACVAAIAAVWMASWRAAAARPAGPEQTVDAPPPRRAFALGRAALVGVAGLGLAYFAFAGALTNIAHRRNPELALRFSPNDAVALTVRANTRFAEQRGRADAETVTLARHSIAALAINPAALQLLGFAATAEGGVRAGLPLMRLADRMSRRDVAVQLWLIEEAVARNAIPDALRHYDVTLRTSESAQALLFPVLTGALANDYMWPHFAPYIREPAPWLPAFVQYGVRNSRDPGAFGRLLVAAGGLPEAPLYRGLESELLIRIAAGSIPAAAQFHRSLRGADPRIIARMTFDPATTDGRFAPLSWQFYQNPAVSASFLASDSGDGLELQAALEPGPTIPLARKGAMLPPGRYRFAATQRLARAAEGASLTWTLRCGGDTGRVLWTAATSVTDTAAAARADLTIPADCPAVTLQLIGASGPSGADFIVSRLSWNRIG